MLVTMMSASAASEHSPWLQILTVFVTAAVVWPLLARLRRVISERRRARWSSDEATTPTSSSSPTLED